MMLIAKSYCLLYASDVSNQMLELYEQNRVPASQGSEVESSVGGGSGHHVGSKPISAQRASHEHSKSDSHGGSSKATENHRNENGSGEAGSVITEHTENQPADKSRPGVEEPAKDKTERTVAHLPDDSAAHDKSRNVNTSDVPVSQSPKDLKLLRDKVKAKLEAKKLQGERTRKKDLIDEDDLIERELEDVELAVDDDKDNQKKNSKTNHMGTEQGDFLVGNNLVCNAEEGEMVDDVSLTVPSRKRKMESPCEKQLGEGKRQHNDNSENVEESQKTSGGGSSSHNSHGD